MHPASTLNIRVFKLEFMITDKNIEQQGSIDPLPPRQGDKVVTILILYNNI